MKALVRIVQYLDCTAHYRLAFYYPERTIRVCTLFVYSDADLARDLVNGARSYYGHTIFFCGMILFWSTVRQSMTEISSTSSEYVAASTAGQRSVSFMFMFAEIFGTHEHGIGHIPVHVPSGLSADTTLLEKLATDIKFD